MIHFMLLISRQGKTRLKKWFSPCTEKEQQQTIKDIRHLILNRPPKLCNFMEWRDYRLVYKRYASLYFCLCVDTHDNELIALEMVHHFVECLDRYFSNVCELDLIFNFHKAYYIADELFLNGELQETSKKTVLRLVNEMDQMMEDKKDAEKNAMNNIQNKLNSAFNLK